MAAEEFEPKHTAWESDLDDVSSTSAGSDSHEDEDVYKSMHIAQVRENDRKLLREEEERETLLSGGSQSLSRTGASGSASHDGANGRKSHRSKAGRRSGKVRRRERSELMYEMEEGGLRDGTSSQSSSSSLDLSKQKDEQLPLSKRRKIVLYSSITIAIAILFCLLALGAFKMSRTSHRRPMVPLLSNGSSTFAPTTILISLDGFRADFLHRNITPTLNSFIAEGVSPKYMLPSFPSVTFPNHYTLVTGLYPESHGVVGNTFWDPELQEEFYYTDPARSMQPKWWLGGEPLWVTAEKQNVKTAIHMWPGSEAHIQLEPTFLDKYDGDESLSAKVHRILELIDTPSTGHNPGTVERPQLIAAYVPVVDADGHTYGPNSTEIRKAIAGVDAMLHDIFTGLDRRNLTNIVNVVVVSDHGMATTSIDRLVQLDDLIDLGLVDHIDGWPLYGLRPKNSSDLRGLYDTLRAESVQNPNFDVYLRDEDMPERYHFSKNERIAPLWIVPKTGWAIVHKEDFDVKDAKSKGQIYHPKGLHGYDHEHPLMRAIFVARGPAFPHEPNSQLEIFQNTEVYNIICDSLGIEPKPNNGTLRLPLSPIGLHSNVSHASNDSSKDILSDEAPADFTSPSVDSEVAKSNQTQSEGDKQSTDDFWRDLLAKMKAVKVWAWKTFFTVKHDTESDSGENE